MEARNVDEKLKLKQMELNEIIEWLEGLSTPQVFTEELKQDIIEVVQNVQF